ncbi:MAG: SemiSWEET transporter [Chitinophagaceae bacterium]|nr:SemiSWEET transporter [Chitinophagaceae bacterium]
MNGVDILGYSAGFITTLTFLPQVLKTYKEKSARDISLNMFLIAATNEIMWVVYGFLKNDMVIVLTNAVVLVLSLTMVVFKLKYSKSVANKIE